MNTGIFISLPTYVLPRLLKCPDKNFDIPYRVVSRRLVTKTINQQWSNDSQLPFKILTDLEQI